MKGTMGQVAWGFFLLLTISVTPGEAQLQNISATAVITYNPQPDGNNEAFTCRVSETINGDRINDTQWEVNGLDDSTQYEADFLSSAQTGRLVVNLSVIEQVTSIRCTLIFVSGLQLTTVRQLDTTPATPAEPEPDPVNDLQIKNENGIAHSFWKYSMGSDGITFCVLPIPSSLAIEQCNITATEYYDNKSHSIYCYAYCINVTAKDISGRRSETVTGCYENVSGLKVIGSVPLNDSDSGALRVTLSTDVCNVTVTSFVNLDTGQTVTTGWNITHRSGDDSFTFIPPYSDRSHYAVAFAIANVANAIQFSTTYREPTTEGEQPGGCNNCKWSIPTTIVGAIIVGAIIALVVVAVKYRKKLRRFFCGDREDAQEVNLEPELEEGTQGQGALNGTGVGNVTTMSVRLSIEKLHQEGSADESEGALYCGDCPEGLVEGEQGGPHVIAKGTVTEASEVPSGPACDEASKEKSEEFQDVLDGPTVSFKKCTSGTCNGAKQQGSEEDDKVSQDPVSYDKVSQVTQTKIYESGLPVSNGAHLLYRSTQMDAGNSTSYTTHPKSNQGEASDGGERQEKLQPKVMARRESLDFLTQGGEDTGDEARNIALHFLNPRGQ